MHHSATDLENQKKLKSELQSDSRAGKLENLTAALLGRLLGVPIAVAKSGFQYGGDAGPAGQQGRRFRIECKKYSDTTSLSDRELLGEIDHAVARDEGLEAWVLVATRSVPEQLGQHLIQKGEKIGVPVVILDWGDNQLSSVAALCAFDPDLVEMEFSKEAGALARALQSVSNNAIAMLRRNLQSWCLGFETLRIRSHELLEKIWNSPRESNAKLGQDAAGGAQAQRVKRAAVHEALSAWWKGLARADAPATVVGWDGTGKTWATLDWLVGNKEEHPVILIVPSSAAVTLSGVSETSVKQLLADCLYEVSGVQNSHHWLRRIDLLFKRPSDEGPVMTVFFDGLNQEPSVPWLPLLKILQSGTFSGRVRVIVSTRKHHFENKLSNLRGLIVPTVPVVVDVYDATPGGELDQMLAFVGLSQVDLHSDLIDLARTPRLFKLVVRFRDRCVEAGHVTLHRLLWEYGRDTFGERAGRSFSEAEWRDWLKEIAQKYRDGIRDFSVKSLAEMASRPDLSEREVYARLSDIIDGRFAMPDPSGNMQFTPNVVAHALGAALIAHFSTVAVPTFATLENELSQWLDPIAGFDQRTEILRAAVSIIVEQGYPAALALTGVLVTAWLQTQNLTDGHRRELALLAPNISDALLDAVEHSDGRAHASARRWAVNALRAIPREDTVFLNKVVIRASHWFSIVSRDVNQHPGANKDIESSRSDRFKHRIGVDASGRIKVVGVDLELVALNDGVLQATVPSILDGFPLAKAMPVFEVAAIASAIGDSTIEGWVGLEWLCLLNEVDSGETADALRELSETVRLRKLEPGVHPNLPAHAAALLLWLSGQELDEDLAISIDPGIDRFLTYEKDYLSRPGRSFFPLERRHAEMALNDTELPLHVRVQRTKELWFDPSFDPPGTFINEIRVFAANIDVDKLDRHGILTIEDYRFEEIEPVLARCAPDLLADLMRRKMQGMAACPAAARYWSAVNATDHFLLAGEAEADAARTLRLRGKEAEDNRERYAASRLLMVEIRDLPPKTQFDELIRTDLKYIQTDFAEVLRPPTPDDVDALIQRYSACSFKQQQDLIILLSVHPVAFSNTAWSWLERFAKQEDHDLGRFVFNILSRADAVRFGQMLVADGWSWSPEAHLWVNHYGTGALIEAMRAIPFDQVASRLAPWRLLEAARMRGADPAEVRFAAKIFGYVLAAEKIDTPDPGSILSVDRYEAKSSPFTFTVSALPRPNEENVNDPVAAFKAAMDTDAQLIAHRRAVETAVIRTREARTSGASLYLVAVDAEDFMPVLQHALDMVIDWLEGARELTDDFRRRVCLAEAAFLALCEALLSYDPIRGAQLWRALRATVTTRYIGAGEVEDLLHMVFRAPDSQPITSLREELLGLERCNTDLALFDLSIAMSYNSKADWLASIIETDRTSAFVWKRKRGSILEGFSANNTLPIPGAWPDGEIRTGYAALEHKAARLRWIEACAHHWWRSYLKAQDPGEAYAAWVLFLRSADRRAWVWMHEDIQAANETSTFFKLKLSHVRLNRSELKRAMNKRTEKLDENFLDRKIVAGVGPWG
ncbi:MAG: hypothetical protein V2B19_15700 [Pseudomonadota bacterium]